MKVIKQHNKTKQMGKCGTNLQLWSYGLDSKKEISPFFKKRNKFVVLYHTESTYVAEVQRHHCSCVCKTSSYFLALFLEIRNSSFRKLNIPTSCCGTVLKDQCLISFTHNKWYSIIQLWNIHSNKTNYSIQSDISWLPSGSIHFWPSQILPKCIIMEWMAVFIGVFITMPYDLIMKLKMHIN